MFSVKALPEFTAWLDHLADASIRGVVVARSSAANEVFLAMWSQWATVSASFASSDIRRAKALAAPLD